MTDKNKTKELLDLIKDPDIKDQIKKKFGNLIKDPKLKKPIEKELRNFIEDPKLKVVLEKELEKKRDSKCKNNLEKKLEDFIEDSKLKSNIEKELLDFNESNPWKENNIDRFDREEFVRELGKFFSEGEESLRDLLKKLPGIAKEDREVFIPLLALNIINNIGEAISIRKKEEKKDPCCKEKFPSDTLAILVALMICLPFMDYQQAFDGNLYDPRVIILGINPRFKADTFYDYEQKEEKNFMVDHMKEVYNTPIRDGNRPMLYKMDENGEKIEPTDLHIAEDDYYYGKPGKFYAEYIDKKFVEKHRHLCLKKEKAENEDRNPIAFLELFPYASNGIGTWWDQEDLNHAFRLLKWDEAVYKDLKVWATSNMNRISQISKPIRDKINLESDELLYSQQWIFCLLYCILIKNRKSQEHDNWFVISTKNKEDHLKRLEAFFNTALNIKKNPNFCFLACKTRKRYLTPNSLYVVKNGVKSIKINNPNAERFWNTSDNSASQNATGSTKGQKNETLNNQAFRHLWGIKKKVKDK
ncbi:hypothetical protein [Levyella massiliensis]|uniref:hypothetical protein n=1 Tax=Levyella massiliensis TaxID=938289 RepID=UPI000361F8BD|nr:hypothetical protein [Levyella massiliensis]